MSTFIAELKASNAFETSSVKLTRYFGGKDSGCKVQLTIDNGSYILLTEEESIKLAKLLLNSFNKEIYPSD